MFCKTVWNGLHIMPDGFIRLCSIGANADKSLDMQRARDKNGNVMHILTHSIEEIMNSDKHVEVRKHNIENPNGWSKHCECCEIRERVTNFNRRHENKSRRIYLMKVDSNHVVSEDNFLEVSKGNPVVDWMPNSLDVRFGNLCNQKCIMCGPQYSNLWYEEYFNYFNTTTFGDVGKVTVTKDAKTGKWIDPPELSWYDDPRWWAKFEQMAPYLRHIYITGGEPMVTPAHDVMLDKLIDMGLSQNIWLEYDSNLTTVNNLITNRWEKFKQVHIRGSMDSIGKEYELIRFGGKWDKFVKNVERIKEIEKSSNGKVELSYVSSCYQIATAYSIVETEEWCKSVNVPYHIRFLEGPRHLSVASLPKHSKEKLIEFYSQYASTSKKAPLIVNYLNLVLNDSDLDSVRKFFKFMDYLDANRSTDWRSIIPRVNDLLLDAIK